MAKEKNRRTVLLAIHPNYANRILSGEKTVEFRRQLFSLDVDCIMLYATSPTKAIVGYARIKSIITDTVSQLWMRFSDESGVGHDAFLKYFANRLSGHAIILEKPCSLKCLVRLDALGSGMKAPQSFRYLDVLDCKSIERICNE